jgi:hypothetical protein
VGVCGGEVSDKRIEDTRCEMGDNEAGDSDGILRDKLRVDRFKY